MKKMTFEIHSKKNISSAFFENGHRRQIPSLGSFLFVWCENFLKFLLLFNLITLKQDHCLERTYCVNDLASLKWKDKENNKYLRLTVMHIQHSSCLQDRCLHIDLVERANLLLGVARQHEKSSHNMRLELWLNCFALYCRGDWELTIVYCWKKGK